MSMKASIIRQFSWVLIVRYFAIFISFVQMIVLINLLGFNDYGKYAIVFINFSLMLSFSRFGLDSTAAHFVSSERIPFQVTFRIMFFISLVVSSIFMILYILLSNYLGSDLYKDSEIILLFQLSALGILPETLTLMFNSTLQGQGKIEISAIIQLIARIIGFTTTILLTLFFNTIGAVVSLTIFSFLRLMLYSIPLRGAIFSSLTSITPMNGNIKKILIKSLGYYLLSITSRSALWVGPTVLKMFTSYTVVSFFQIATNLVSVLTQVTNSINYVLFPRFSKLDFQNEKQKLKDTLFLSMKYSFFLQILFASGLLAFLDIIMVLFKDGLNAIPTVIILIGSAPIIYGFTQVITDSLLLGTAKIRSLLVANIIFGLVYFGSSLVLVPSFKSEGLALSLVLARLLILPVNLYFTNKHFLKGLINYNQLVHTAIVFMMYYMIFISVSLYIMTLTSLLRYIVGIIFLLLIIFFLLFKVIEKEHNPILSSFRRFHK